MRDTGTIEPKEPDSLRSRSPVSWLYSTKSFDSMALSDWFGKRGRLSSVRLPSWYMIVSVMRSSLVVKTVEPVLRRRGG